MLNLLSTRAIPDHLIRLAETAGIRLEVVPFITVKPSIGPEAEADIRRVAGLARAAVVFTSKHAVTVVAEALKRIGSRAEGAGWELWCVSPVTAQVAAAHFPRQIVHPGGAYASDVAAQILARPEIGEVYFFCGQKRRDTLKEQLTQKGVVVHEIVVYETLLTPQRVHRAYGGILFFSPSAVESFFLQNTPSAGTIYFAIGRTTAAALGERAADPVVVSPATDADSLVQTAIAYFAQNSPQI
jgi:uroporphyrinogen-III synthase